MFPEPHNDRSAFYLLALGVLALAFFAAISSCSAPAADLGNIHTVDASLFRSAQPTPAGYTKLRAMGIKTVLKLNAEDLEEERAAAKANGIRLLEYPISGLFSPSEKDEAAIQAILEDGAFRPLLFHCTKGADRTGLTAALYRVHRMNWTPAAAHSEWMADGHSPLLFTMDNFFWEHTK